jgi:FKBP-type peptidyl-prolyl cis-trans isomerase
MKAICCNLKYFLLLGFLHAAATVSSQSVEGYTKTPRGLLYQLVIDAGQPKGSLGDIIKMNTVYSTWNDSVLFSTYEGGMGPVQFTISPPSYNGDPMEGFILLGEGDSALFLMPVDSAFKNQELPPFAKKGEYVKVGVSVLSRMSKETYERKKAEEAKKQTEMEAITIEDFLTRNGLSAKKTASGLYYIISEQGTGAKAAAGSTVTVNYTGKLLDGKVFDSSLKPGRQPYSFKLGVGQVIKGWDEGIALFSAGGKGTLLIPSAMGYGSRGSGQIPPNSILIFDIELLEVR